MLLRKDSNNDAVTDLNVEKVYGDLRDKSVVFLAVQGCDRIYHCAALVSTVDGDRHFYREIYDCNVIGTQNILNAALHEGVVKVVVSGSFSAVGHDPNRPSDETI